MEQSPIVLPQTTLRIQDLVVISGSLRNVVSKCYGPKGRQTLLTSSTGQVIVTHDGLNVLSALHFSHPVAKCIVDGVKSFSENYGDGCKTLVIYIHELFLAIEGNATRLDFTDCDAPAYRSAVVKCLYNFLNDDIPSLCDKLKEVIYSQNCKVKTVQPNLLGNPLELVVKTCFHGTLSVQASNHISNMVSQFLAGVTSSEAMHFVSKFLDSCVIMVLNQTYTMSHVSDGIFLHGSFHGHFYPVSRFKFIIMQCPLEGNLNSKSNDIVGFATGPTASVLTFRSSIASEFLLNVKTTGVSLILTTQKVPDYVLQICSKLNISILTCLDSRDAEFLACISGKSPVTTVYEELSQCNIVVASSCEKITSQGKQFLRLQMYKHSMDWAPRCLFLSSPTEGLGQQLRLTVKKCVKIADHLFSLPNCYSYNESENGIERANNDVRQSSCEVKNIVAGGGYFDNIFAHFIQHYFQEDISQYKKFCCVVVRRMLNAVPKVLYDNHSANQANHGHGYVFVQREMEEALTQNKIAGFNLQGKLCNTLENGIADVLSIKIATIFAAVNLVAKLLRVESIIGVNRLYHDSSQCDENDEDIG